MLETSASQKLIANIRLCDRIRRDLYVEFMWRIRDNWQLIWKTIKNIRNHIFIGSVKLFLTTISRCYDPT